MKHHHTTRCAALLAALALCGASAFAAMPDADFVRLCARGTAAQVQQALADGANANARVGVRGGGEDTALHNAAMNADPGALKALLAAGADIGAKGLFGRVALHSAAGASGSAEAVRVLIAAGADVNARDEDGATPLMLAMNHESAAGAKALLAAGANPRLADKDGHDALWHARQSWHKDDAELARLLQGGGKGDGGKGDSGKDEGAIRFLREVQEKLGDDDDAWMLAHTSKAIQKAAQDDYDYDCAKAPCYGWWILRTSSQDGEELLGVESAGEGWYVVRLRYYGGDVAIRMRVVREGGGYRITGLVNPDRKIEIR